MSYTLGEDQRQIQDLIRRVAREKVAPRADAIDRTAEYPQDMFDLLQELGLVVPKTHDLEDLLDLLLPHTATLAPLRRALRSLTRYAVDVRYPDVRATTRHMEAALRQAERVRRELRVRLGLPA